MKTLVLVIILVGIAALALLLGRDSAGGFAFLDPSCVLDGGTRQFVLVELRLPRVLLAVLVGASLACSGLLYQTTLHNPLASPFTLGTSAGASLGAYLAFLAMGNDPIGIAAAAFAGAFVVSLPTYMLAAAKRIPPEAVLLTGVALGFGATAVISGMTYIASETTVFAYSRWLLGSLADIGFEKVTWLAAPALAPVVLCWVMRSRLDALAGGDELAVARGVNVTGLRAWAILCVTLAVGASVAACGPIAFVGLIVPHMARAIAGSTHRILAIAVPVLGAVLLTVCDLFGRTVLPTADIPIGVMTAAIGTPAFILLLWLRFRRTRA